MDTISPETRIQAMCTRCYSTYDGKFERFQDFANQHKHAMVSITKVFKSQKNSNPIVDRPVKPEIPGKHICQKCNGTGFYCSGYVDGHPYSNTGFECFSCNGKGWK